MQAEMPKYRCHKEVWALKIEEAKENEDGSITLFFTNKIFAPILVKDGDEARFSKSCTEEDKGYYVMYKGGYKSWSPTKAFEEGYTRI